MQTLLVLADTTAILFEHGVLLTAHLLVGFLDLVKGLCEGLDAFLNELISGGEPDG